MGEIIDAKQAAEICGVSPKIFKSARKGIGAPAPLPKRRVTEPDTFDAEVMREWAAKHDFWELATDYLYQQRYGDLPRKHKKVRREYIIKPSPTKGKISKEITNRHDAVKLRPELKQFLLGRFAPAPVRVAQDMKLLRARMNKPKTTRITLEGGW